MCGVFFFPPFLIFPPPFPPFPHPPPPEKVYAQRRYTTLGVPRKKKEKKKANIIKSAAVKTGMSKRVQRKKHVKNESHALPHSM